MQARERKLGVARVSPDPAALLGTTKQLEAGAPASEPFQLSAQATFRSGNGGASASATAAVAVPFRSLGAAFDNVGVSDDSARADRASRP